MTRKLHHKLVMLAFEITQYTYLAAIIFGYIAIQFLFEFDLFQDYLKHKYDIYCDKTGDLIDIIDKIEKQPWLIKIGDIESQLYLLQMTNEEILQEIRSCRDAV